MFCVFMFCVFCALNLHVRCVIIIMGFFPQGEIRNTQKFQAFMSEVRKRSLFVLVQAFTVEEVSLRLMSLLFIFMSDVLKFYLTVYFFSMEKSERHRRSLPSCQRGGSDQIFILQCHHILCLYVNGFMQSGRRKLCFNIMSLYDYITLCPMSSSMSLFSKERREGK